MSLICNSKLSSATLIELGNIMRRADTQELLQSGLDSNHHLFLHLSSVRWRSRLVFLVASVIYLAGGVLKEEWQRARYTLICD